MIFQKRILFVIESFINPADDQQEQMLYTPRCIYPHIGAYHSTSCPTNSCHR